MKYPIYTYKRENNYFSQYLQMDTVLVLHLAKLPLGLWIGQEESQSPSQGFDEHTSSLGMCVAVYIIAFECFNFPQKSHPFFSSRPQMVYYIFPPIISCPKLFWVCSPLVVFKSSACHSPPLPSMLCKTDTYIVSVFQVSLRQVMTAVHNNLQIMFCSALSSFRRFGASQDLELGWHLLKMKTTAVSCIGCCKDKY